MKKYYEEGRWGGGHYAVQQENDGFSSNKPVMKPYADNITKNRINTF